MSDKSKKEKKKKPEDLDMNLDEFGSLNSSVSIEKLNDYLDENLEDKKLKDRKKKSGK
ncbi:MAG: hypothetical protein R3275_02865 [Saprospiraceae bacterium]|nr:hypothetical protein [Saprospiraceae bacterium]